MDRQFFFPFVDMSTPKGPIKSNRSHSKWIKARIRLQGHKEQILRKLGFPDLTNTELETLTDMLENVSRVIARVSDYLEEYEDSMMPAKNLDFEPPKSAESSCNDFPDGLPNIEYLGESIARLRKFLGITSYDFPGVFLNPIEIAEYEAEDYRAAPMELVIRLIDHLNSELSTSRSIQSAVARNEEIRMSMK